MRKSAVFRNYSGPVETGMLFKPNDPADLKEKIRDLWEHPIAHFETKGAVMLPAYAERLMEHYCPGGKVTVVVPVYNTAAYLDRCVQSIVNQTHQDLQILLIDDGSTDESGLLCDRWAEKDKRIQVVHQENIGLGMTRNAGIARAVGDAVCFVDSDDYILPQTITKALGLLRGRDAVVFGMRWETAGRAEKEKTIDLSQHVYQGKEVRRDFLPKLLRQEGNLPISSCAGLYSMRCIRKANWRFPSERNIIAEDVYALLNLYGDVESVAVLPDALYVYCQRPGSLTHHYRIDRFEKLKHFYGACMTLCRERDYPKQVVRSCASVFLDIVIGCLKQEAARNDWYHIRDILNDPVVQYALAELTEKQRIKKRLLFGTLRRRQVSLCSLLLKAQNLLEGVAVL